MKYLNHLYLSVMISVISLATVQARDLGEGAVNGSTSRALQNSERLYEIWTGIARLTLQSGQSCSAVLLNTRNRQGNATGPGYLLTSGHCVLFQYGSARINMPYQATVTFKYFYDTPERQLQYSIRSARWTSMSGTDLAILEIDATLAALISAGINPLNLASHQINESHDSLNVGTPQGFNENGLRLSACDEQTAGTFIDHPGVFPLAMRNRCDLRPGNSGSPMLNRNTNEITGIVSKIGASRAIPEPEGCEDSSSCKANRFNYSYSANFLSACFVDGVFTNDGPDCALKPVELTVTEPWKLKTYVERSRNTAGQFVLPTWDFRFSLDAPFYRFKAVRDAKECKVPHHYSAAIRTEDAHIDTEIGPSNGAHALCIIGVDSAQQSLTTATLNNVFTSAAYLNLPPQVPLQAR